MFYHFIAIASSYFEGRRVAYHYASKEKIGEKTVNHFLGTTKSKLDREDFGLHVLITKYESWASVIEYDSFFKDILICEDVEEFVSFLTKDKNLTAIDIAKFFLTIQPMSQLKLQKMVYFAYATYLESTGKQLFSDKIVAYRYGPVVESVYQEYKFFGRETIKENEQVKFSLEDIKLPQSIARITISEDGDEILHFLLVALKRYGDKSPGELVDITHSDGSPWSSVYLPGKNQEITDSVILSRHKYEIAVVKNLKIQ